MLLALRGRAGRQLDASCRHLARGSDQRNRATAREIEGLKLGGGRPGQCPGGRRIAQAGRRIAPPQGADDPPLDRRGPVVLDQLLGDGPGERLKRIGPPTRPYRGAGADRRADQRIGPEPREERTQVEIDPKGNSHPRDRPCRGAKVGGLSTEQHAPRGELCDTDQNRQLPLVQQPVDHSAADAGQSILPVHPGQPERRSRFDLDPQLTRRGPVG